MPTKAAIAVDEAARDQGLVRSIGPVTLAGAFVGILIGSGIFTVPAIMAQAVGAWAPLAYVGCALAVGLVMLCFAEGCSRVPTAGGPAGFVAAAFGPFAGFVANACNWGSSVLSSGAIAAAAADAIGTTVPALAAGPVRGAAIIGWFAVLAVINTAGVGLAARIVAIATSVKLLPLVVLIAVGLWFVVPANLVLPLAPGHGDIGRAAIVGIFMFTGIETSLAIAGEVRDPARNIPRAIIGSLAGYALLCVAVQITVQGIMGDALGASTAPLGDAMARISPALGVLLLAGAVVSMLGFTASDALASPRMLFAMARAGLLPALVGRVHPRTHTPHIAIVAHTGIAAALAVTGSFAGLVVLSTLVVLIVYGLGCAAAVKLAKADIAIAGPPVRVPWLPAVAALGVAVMLVVAAQSTGAEAVAIAIFLGAVTLIYTVRRVPEAATG
jgi:amino acid transporter